MSEMLRIPSGRGQGANVVALGGGHGLAATLRSLRRVTDDLTAIVGVADNGGSSGRLREEFDVLPPGDLRMALAALCGDDTWGRTWSRVVQHRFGGHGDLAGHSLGNLLITALWEETADAVEGLDWVAALLGAHGRVLPCASEPMTILADVEGHGTIAGQVQVATTSGRVNRVWVEPALPAAVPDAVLAVREADVVVMGPGSWFTSVIPHLLVPELAAALSDTSARRVLVLNLNPDPETQGYDIANHIDVIADHAPTLRFDVVLADSRFVTDEEAIRAAAGRVGAHVVFTRLGYDDPRRAGQHDPDLLASALAPIIEHGRISAWP